MAVAPVVFWLSHEQLIFPATSLDICRRRPGGRKLLGPKNAPIQNPTARLLQSLGGKSSQITFVGSAHIQYGFLYTGPGAHFLQKNCGRKIFFQLWLLRRTMDTAFVTKWRNNYLGQHLPVTSTDVCVNRNLRQLCEKHYGTQSCLWGPGYIINKSLGDFCFFVMYLKKDIYNDTGYWPQ